MEETQVAAAMQEVFGPVLGKRLLEPDLGTPQTDRPAKATKPGEAKGKGKGKGKKKAQTRRLSSSASGFNEEPDWYAEAIALMSRMMIRQEDVLTILRQSTGWVWWLRVQAPTIVPDLFQAAQVWKKEVTDPKSRMAGDLASVGAPVVHPSSIESCPPVRRHGAARAGDAERLVHQGSQQAITLDLPGQEGPYDLQLLLNTWHEQAHTHALTGDATL
eukprot:s9571_g2.t1